ncbi:putative ankyrin repeat protein [Eutypa lata UCREL1]|uniref:Putative ankyrin repeat protein n=1 Tax=Eutypa lata (strain UCR-EL1) TaxID=1287681 RepID=M7TBH2_EUTLA|nr:putative ankyrin repeat protein [Eutypa lata UCREL1]
MADDHEHEGASVKEQLIEACRRNNVDLLQEIISNCKNDDEISNILNNTTTVMGNHLYHEAALQGNYEVIDHLLDQPNFECDPTNRSDGDTPLHSAIRWINSEPPAQREFGNALVEMMLEAGSSTRVRNRARLTPYQLVDPRNKNLRDLIQRHEYAALNAGDFVDAGEVKKPVGAADAKKKSGGGGGASAFVDARDDGDDDSEDDYDDDAEFSGSDEDERAEFERRKAAKKGR